MYLSIIENSLQTGSNFIAEWESLMRSHIVDSSGMGIKNDNVKIILESF